MANNFGVGDEVALRGIVRPVRQGHRVTIMAESSYVDLVGEAKHERFTKAPKGRQKRLVASEA